MSKVKKKLARLLEELSKIDEELKQIQGRLGPSNQNTVGLSTLQTAFQENHQILKTIAYLHNEKEKIMWDIGQIERGAVSTTLTHTPSQPQPEQSSNQSGSTTRRSSVVNPQIQSQVRTPVVQQPPRTNRARFPPTVPSPSTSPYPPPAQRATKQQRQALMSSERTTSSPASSAALRAAQTSAGGRRLGVTSKQARQTSPPTRLSSAPGPIPGASSPPPPQSNVGPVKYGRDVLEGDPWATRKRLHDALENAHKRRLMENENNWWTLRNEAYLAFKALDDYEDSPEWKEYVKNDGEKMVRQRLGPRR